MYTLVLSPIGTEGREIDRPNNPPNTVRGRPRRMKGAPTSRAPSTTSYAPPAIKASPVYKKVDAGVRRMDASTGSSAGAGSISRGASERINSLFLDTKGNSPKSSMMGNSFSIADNVSPIVTFVQSSTLVINE